MRIGIDAHHLNGKPQGSRTYLLELIRALSQLIEDTDELHIFSFYPEQTKKLVQGHHHSIFPKSAKLRIPFVVPMLELLHGIDVFHSQYIKPPWSLVSEVVTIHDVLFETHKELFRDAFSTRSTHLIRHSARRAQCVLTVSEFSRQAIIEQYGISEDRVVVTLNGVDTNRFTVLSDRPKELATRYGLDRPFILTVGRLEPRKNLERLIESFANLNLDMALVIAGVADFQHKGIVEAATKLPTGSVRFLGAIADEDLPGLYNLAEILAYPSLIEGFGMPLLESMACGTPVVTSGRGALREVGGDAVIYVDPEDIDSIAHGLMTTLNDRALQEQLRVKGLARAKQFSWEESARHTLAAYRHAL